MRGWQQIGEVERRHALEHLQDRALPFPVASAHRLVSSSCNGPCATRRGHRAYHVPRGGGEQDERVWLFNDASALKFGSSGFVLAAARGRRILSRRSDGENRRCPLNC